MRKFDARLPSVVSPTEGDLEAALECWAGGDKANATPAILAVCDFEAARICGRRHQRSQSGSVATQTFEEIEALLDCQVEGEEPPKSAPALREAVACRADKFSKRLEREAARASRDPAPALPAHKLLDSAQIDDRRHIRRELLTAWERAIAILNRGHPVYGKKWDAFLHGKAPMPAKRPRSAMREALIVALTERRSTLQPKGEARRIVNVAIGYLTGELSEGGEEPCDASGHLARLLRLVALYVEESQDGQSA